MRRFVRVDKDYSGEVMDISLEDISQNRRAVVNAKPDYTYYVRFNDSTLYYLKEIKHLGNSQYRFTMQKLSDTLIPILTKIGSYIHGET